MSHLLDANLLLACAWASHDDHVRANRWLDSRAHFATSSVTQMGFLRVSMSPGYGAAFADALAALNAIIRSKSHRFAHDDTDANSLPPLDNGKEVTDAHLVRLAARHKIKLATLDDRLCGKPWALGIAENPLRPG